MPASARSPAPGRARRTGGEDRAVRPARGRPAPGPGHAPDTQRDEVESAVKDPTQNVFIASGYLARLKAESEFADVPADRMTDAQYQELAARYNGGPYWESDDAQRYGRDFVPDLPAARAAIQACAAAGA